MAMGKGSFLQGIEQLTTVHAEKLNSIGGSTDPFTDWRGVYRPDSGEHLLLVY